MQLIILKTLTQIIILQFVIIRCVRAYSTKNSMLKLNIHTFYLNKLNVKKYGRGHSVFANEDFVIILFNNVHLIKVRLQ